MRSMVEGAIRISVADPRNSLRELVTERIVR
jgi:hypothetical protein